MNILWPKFEKRGGLLPVIACDRATGKIFMLAYADEEAFRLTLETGFAHYYSTSRQTLWKKGETSGFVQRVTDVLTDCDGDALLYVVDQTGPACHTGSSTCFSRSVIRGSLEPSPLKKVDSLESRPVNLASSVLPEARVDDAGFRAPFGGTYARRGFGM